MNTREISTEFLSAIATERRLSQAELAALEYALQGEPISEIAAQLKTSQAAIRKRLGEVYRKFEIEGAGPGKLNRLRDKLQSLQSRQSSEPQSLQPKSCQISWGGAPRIGTFHGRHRELAELSGWILEEQCRVVAILGMGGLGKTSLSVKLAEQLAPKFDYLVWRSLRTPKSPEKLILDLLETLRSSKNTTTEDTIIQVALPKKPTQEKPDITEEFQQQLAKYHQSLIERLIERLQSTRCLLILDGFESVFENGKASTYRPGFEAYETLIEEVGASEHNSCLVLSSREKPRGVGVLQGNKLSVRTYNLIGLSEEDAQKLLEEKGLNQIDGDSLKLVKRYCGNPLALKIAATTIQEFFGGSIHNFLDRDVLVFDNLKGVLKQQFQRLSPPEKEVIYWLAINRRASSLSDLQNDIFDPQRRADLVYNLRSLEQRSLIERQKENQDSYRLQPLVLEFVTRQLVKEIIQELTTSSYSRFNRYALMKANAEESLRKEQQRHILMPVCEQLQGHYGSPAALQQRLMALLKQRRVEAPQVPGYFGGNLFNLLAKLSPHGQMPATDFSNLPIWQAYFQGLNLQKVKFQDCDIDKAVFTETIADIVALSFGPVAATGKDFLAAGDTNGRIHLWQLDATGTAQQFVDWDGHLSWVRAIAFSPSGRWLASGGDDNQLRLWNLQQDIRLNHQPLVEWEIRHKDWVRSVAFSPDERYLASSSDVHIQLWSLTTKNSIQPERCFSHAEVHTEGRSKGSSEGHAQAPSPITKTRNRARVRAIAFSPDGNLLASAGDDCTIKLWAITPDTSSPHPFDPTHQPNVSLPILILDEHQGWVRAVVFTPRGDHLISSSDDGSLKIWDVKTGQCLKTLEHHQDRVRSLCLSPDGKILASGSDDRSVTFWDLAAETQLKFQPNLAHSRIWAMDFIQTNGKLLLASGDDAQTIHLCEVADHRCITLKTMQGYAQGVRAVLCLPAPSNQRPMIVSGGDDHSLKFWDGASGQCKSKLFGHQGRIWAIAFAPQTACFASASDDCTIRLWSLKDGTCLRVLTGHRHWVRTVAFSPNGRILASAGDDETIRLWDVLTGEFLCEGKGHSHWIRSLCFSPDGESLISGGDDQKVKLWDVRKVSQIHYVRDLAHHSEHRIRSVAFSADGAWLASGSDDGQVFLWRSPEDPAPRSLAKHRLGVKSITFSPDGQWLASAGDDQLICLWNLHDLSEMEVDNSAIPIILNSPTFSEPTHGVRSLAFSADSQFLVTGDRNDRIELWDVEQRKRLADFKPERPYEGMDITNATGINEVQRATLKALGAIEKDKPVLWMQPT